MEMRVFAAGLRELAPKVVWRDGYHVLEYAEAVDAEATLRRWAETHPAEPCLVERGFNHCHVASLIPWLDGMDAESLLEIGRVYRILLENELRRAFPDQEFEIIVDGDSRDEVDDDPNAYQITFCRREQAANPG